MRLTLFFPLQTNILYRGNVLPPPHTHTPHTQSLSKDVSYLHQGLHNAHEAGKVTIQDETQFVPLLVNVWFAADDTYHFIILDLDRKKMKLNE